MIRVTLPTGECSGIPAAGPGQTPVRRSLWTLLSGTTGGLLQQFARYLVVGGLAFVVDFGLLYVLTEFVGIHYLASAAIAFLFGMLTNYWLSRVWVFDQRAVENVAVEFAIFSAIGVVGLGLNEGIIWFFRERIHFHYMLAKAVSAGIVLIWNFGARRALLFSQRPAAGFWPRLRALSWISTLSSIWVAAACFAFCLAVQAFSGAWSADFTSYPDEPSHFVGAVMMRDWMVSGQWLTPFAFARNYYDHYPFFAIGYWPPLFGFVTGFWMVLTGVGRLQALLIPAAFAAGTSWLIFHLIRLRAGIVAGLCASTLYLCLPEVRRSVCAVMVDHMTTFLCLSVAVCLIRYLKHPLFRNGVLCAICCGCAILSKYSAAYLVALPFAAVVLLRRFKLLRKPGLLVQPFVVGLMVGPWALWTRNFAFYGLPAERAALTANRAALFVLALFKLFPPVLMAVVILGLILALIRPAAWHDDLVVLALLCAGHLAFLILSPVGTEYRYLLLPAAVVLVISLAGWLESLALMSPERRRTGLVLGTLLTLAFTVSQFRDFVRMPQGEIRKVVAFIAQDPARAAQRVVMPPTRLEGPVIAEFARQSHQRPSGYLLRPSKLLARSDWFGLHDSSVFATPAEMMAYFRQNPVDWVIWSERSRTALETHELIMKEMLQDYPLSWHRVWSSPADGSASPWSIYQYYPSPGEVMSR